MANMATDAKDAHDTGQSQCTENTCKFCCKRQYVVVV